MSQLLGNAFEIQLDAVNYESRDGDGTVGAGRLVIEDLAGARVGLWEAEPGVIGGVTTDEVFVVLEGRAEVTFEDTQETIQVGPGSIVRLKAGQTNIWRTFERLRKVAVSLPAS
ncbi:cupin domain-containing protein [bacterium RCC_150]